MSLSTIFTLRHFLCTSFFFYHSWAIASCAVSRWSWSTSISDATKVLAKIKVRKEENENILKTFLVAFHYFKMSLVFSSANSASIRKDKRIWITSHQNQKCHPSMVNQIHSLLIRSLGKGSYHGCLSPLHLRRHRKEGSQTNYRFDRSGQVLR